MKKNKFYIISLIFIVIFLVIIYGYTRNLKEENLQGLTEKTGTTFLMDTLIQMRVYGTDPGDLIDKSFARLREIENEMSKTIKESAVNRINENPGKFVSVDDDTYKVIEKALHYAELTEGKFDPSIGPLVELWGIGTADARVPTDSEIEQAKAKVNYKFVEIDPVRKKVRLAKEGMMLDLGAIAKGYAADDVQRILESAGIESAFINLGGNVLVVGGKPDGTPWRVGIQDPRRNRGNAMASIEVKDKTIVTSGNYERYFEEDGVIYHHIIDPTIGYPANSGIISASIISNNSFDADALSTSVFILGVEEGLKLINGLDGVEAMIIKDNLSVIITEGLKDKVTILNKDFRLSRK